MAAKSPTENTREMTGAEGGHGGGGLPQLNVHDFAPQLVWLALTFGALYWIMSRIALPRIADVLEKRRDQIADDIDAAKKFQQEAELAETAYKTDLAAARSRALEIARKTREELNARTERKKAEVESQIAERMLEAEKRIRAAKQTALQEVGNIAADTTATLVERMTGQKMDSNQLTKLIASLPEASGKG